MNLNSTTVFGRAASALAAGLFLFFAVHSKASDAATFSLFSVAQVDGEGVFLQQIVKSPQPLPVLKLCASPAFGKVTVLTRAQVNDLIAAAAPELAATNWGGAASIRISRSAHEFAESDLLTLLTATLQRDCVKDKGDLELVLTQPWSTPMVPNEPLTLKVLEMPSSGIIPSFIVRFELRTARETVGIWQATVKAQVWREVWMARSSLTRSEPLSEADIARERRDVLSVHETLADISAGEDALEIAEFVSPNAILLARHIRAKAVIHRGQVADARLQDGALNIRMSVVALEDGAPGQTIRLRNPLSLRYLTGKVLDAQNIAISL